MKVTGRRASATAPTCSPSTARCAGSTSPAESGDVAVFAETRPRRCTLGLAFLAPEAHTVAVDPRTHLVYFPLERGRGAAAPDHEAERLTRRDARYLRAPVEQHRLPLIGKGARVDRVPRAVPRLRRHRLGRAAGWADAVGSRPRGRSAGEHGVAARAAARGARRREPPGRQALRSGTGARDARAPLAAAAGGGALCRRRRARSGRNTGESVSVGLVVGDEIVLVARHESEHRLRVVATIGDVIAPHRSAMGKAILAHVPAPRRDEILAARDRRSRAAGRGRARGRARRAAAQGYACDEEVFAVGLRCRAAPILGAGRRGDGAISIAGPSSRFTEELAERNVPALLEETRRLWLTGAAPVTGVRDAAQQVYERRAAARARRTHSNSRLRDPHPLYVERAEGAYVWDVDGTRWLDCVMGNGAVMLGHADPRVTEAVSAAVASGVTTGWESPASAEAAALLAGRSSPNSAASVREHRHRGGAPRAPHRARGDRRRTRAKAEGAYHGWFDAVWVSCWGAPDAIGPAERPASPPGPAASAATRRRRSCSCSTTSSDRAPAARARGRSRRRVPRAGADRPRLRPARADYVEAVARA